MILAVAATSRSGVWAMVGVEDARPAARGRGAARAAEGTVIEGEYRVEREVKHIDNDVQ